MFALHQGEGFFVFTVHDFPVAVLVAVHCLKGSNGFVIVAVIHQRNRMVIPDHRQNEHHKNDGTGNHKAGAGGQNGNFAHMLSLFFCGLPENFDFLLTLGAKCGGILVAGNFGKFAKGVVVALDRALGHEGATALVNRILLNV